MRNILKTSIFAFMLIALGSCTNDKDPIATSQGGPVLLTPESGSEFVLNPANEDDVIATLVWDHSEFGVPTSGSYTVEIAETGTNFADLIVAGTTSNRFLSWTVSELNGLLAAPRFTPYTQTEIDVRIKSSLGTAENAIVQYSNVITIKVTPYTTENPTIAVPGNHQGWAPVTAPTLASSGYGETDYEGYVWLDGEFKFLAPKPDGTFDWGTTDWGDDGSFSGILVEQNESNGTVAAGYYRVKADTAELTYSTEPTVWGIIGAATPGGWDNSTPLTYNATTKIWSADMTLSAGEFKFRANNAWTIDLGGDPDGDGSMNYSGPNLSVATGGSYHVVLDLSHPRQYTYSVTLN